MESELERERKEILKLKQEGESINKVAGRLNFHLVSMSIQIIPK